MVCVCVCPANVSGDFRENLTAYKQAFGSGYASMRMQEGTKTKVVKTFTDVVIAPTFRCEREQCGRPM